jgi:hypothetical protein
MTSNNLAIWDRLGRTDPSHTKGFSRAGGFKGTAIKPIYTEQKMTEVFGPAGKGWGMGEPSFQTLPGHNGEVLVYCTVSLWWVDPTDENGTVNTVFGVGGDKAVTYIKANEQYNRPERWENDDEAFKKAFTDAVGNAMKHLGMSADVHMGRFDDSKYVNEVRAELAEQSAAPAFPPKFEEQPEMANTAAKEHWKTISEAMFKATTLKQLQGVWQRHYPVYQTLPESLQSELLTWKDELKDKLMAQAETPPTAPVAPNFDNLETAAQ